jgi:outer membrane protein TolC
MDRSLIAAGALALIAGGCDSLPPRAASESLRENVIESVRRSLEETSPPAAPEAEPNPAEALSLPEERLGELREMAGPESYMGAEAELGPGLLGPATLGTPLRLAEALSLAIDRDTAVRAVRLSPPIARAQLVAAEAAFDWVLFADVERSFTDQEQPVPVVGMTPVGTGLSRSDGFSGSAGFRKLLTTNGTLELSANLDVFNNSTPGFTRIPDPARTASLDLIFNQPLLRNFGAEVAMADVWLAENALDDAVEQTRQVFFDTLTEVQLAYWNLHQARQRLLIQQRLLERGIDTREALRGRYGFDVTDAELADAAARVETRRGDLIRAQAAVRDASDRLKRLINDPERALLEETVLRAIDEPLTVDLRFDLLEAIAGAIERRPDVRRALIAVRDELIFEDVARNAVLPQLDLFVRLSALGLEDEADDAFEEAAEVDFFNTVFGLSFEYPLGNREALSRERAARLRTLQASIDYRDAVRRAIEDVKIALRTVKTNFRLVRQTRLARIAAAENLRALEVEEQTIRGLTPDFLNLKLNRQEALARAELDEAQARSEYARAVAQAARALGLTLEQSGVEVDPAALDQAATELLRRSPRTPLTSDGAAGEFGRGER